MPLAAVDFQVRSAASAGRVDVRLPQFSLGGDHSVKRAAPVPFVLLVLLSLAALFVKLPASKVVPAGDPINSGDVAWMLTAAALVLLMTPGLSFFYGGM